MKKPLRTTASVDWQELLDFNMRFAIERLVGIGEVGRMFVLHTDDGAVLIPGEWSDEVERQNIYRLVRLVALAHDATAVAMVTEAWMRKVKRRSGESRAEFDARTGAVMPSQAEDRIEVVVATLAYRDAADARHTLSKVQEIVRGADAKPTRAKPIDLPTTGMSGTMTDLMPERRPTAVERAAARTLLTMIDLNLEKVAMPN